MSSFQYNNFNFGWQIGEEITQNISSFEYDNETHKLYLASDQGTFTVYDILTEKPLWTLDLNALAIDTIERKKLHIKLRESQNQVSMIE